MVGMHTFCCGLPALAMLAAAVSGTASGVTLLSEIMGKFHDFLHGQELWILAVSAALVVVGGGLEGLARRSHRGLGFPWLFAFSVGCFLVNVGIILVHRAA
jgi:hypothetical protein